MKQGKQYTSKQTIINRQQKQHNQWKYFETGSEQIRYAYSNAYLWYVTILAIICKSWFCGMKKACRLYMALAPLCYNSFTESYPVYLPELLSTIHPDNFAPFLTQKPSAYLSQQQQQQKKLLTTSFCFHGPDTVELITVWCSSLSINSFFQAEVQYPAVHFRVCSICTCSIYVCSDQILVMFGY